MHFTKMHGLGNDYLYVYGEVPDNICELSQKLSDRHFGAGSDGMIYISPSAIADFKMRIFNADGSEAMMCGNGIRCVGKYVYDKGYTDKTKLLIETLSGIKTLTLQTMGGKVKFVTVEMGQAEVKEDLDLEIPSATPATVRCTPVSVGNPHAVIFVEDAEAVPLADIGPLIEHHEAFPGGTNVEFAQVLSENRIRMRVWERGSGITMACGTGACATAAAAASKGLCVVSSPISVELDGGTLEITVAPDHTIGMTGPAATVYEGEVTE
ncbi:MAG: diaminopimelate epimerase [Lachnospiraceae bacterium]|nr:diaminopimelate epimerase [Lachnospiraceae bacterium]